GRRPRSDKPSGVGQVLVPKDVESAHIDVAGWQFRQIVGARRRCVRRDILAAGHVSEQRTPCRPVVVVVPRHKGLEAWIADCCPIIEHRGKQQLLGHWWSASIPRQQSYTRGK